MTQRMLIDARHPEETRVAVAQGNRIEEFDFESTEHKQLKGNIYLAKVTRVEPSLQAAFIEYGGNRHGFLAFSEIHPDYYQIPKSDRDALLAEEAEHAAEEERLRSAEIEAAERGDDEGEDGDHDEVGMGSERSPVDESAADELRKKRQALRRRYKIQDVIQRRQVLLVQVVKEERGNKGAALTTYLSLAGRYCVLMPNTSHGGGISRKISNGADRKRLKSMMADLNLPSTMGLIVRTAGLERTKTEIKRDFDYLARLWDEIRERTLGSTAPALIYRDSDLVKRAIRDLYNKEIDEVIVEGDEGYKAARGFMKLLMPSHVKRVKSYGEATPLFQRYGIEDQLNAMYNPVVQLKSGGYLVINPTEALVSIDINSGRSTREHNIEQTAFATNLEAAAEIARQLRLRDMAGLVVIDFIDMEQNSHNRKVEKAMKDALKNDRARIQVGRISGFGLMEMSRQRLRTGVLEASTHACPHCEGTGLMRTASSSGLSALRLIEDEAARGKGNVITLRCGREAAIYVLNKKRAELAEIEERYGVSVEVVIDEGFEGARMAVESNGPRPVGRPRPTAPIIEEDDEEIVEDEIDEDDADEEESDDARGREPRDEGRSRRRRRGGRGRNRRHDGDEDRDPAARGSDHDSDEEGSDPEPRDADEHDEERGEKRRGRRGRRGGRGRRGRGRREDGGEIEGGTSPMIDTPVSEEAPVDDANNAEAAEEKPKARRRPRAAKALADDIAAQADIDAEPASEPKPRRTRAKKAVADSEAPADAPVSAEADDSAETAPAKPKRSRAKAAAPVEADAPAPGDEVPAEAPKKASRAKAAPKSAAKPAAKAKAKPAAKADEADAAPAATAAGEADPGAGDVGPDGEPRKGWWQRTFG